jgi:hypothetical protein
VLARGARAARPMITEFLQPISCRISAKTESLRDHAAPRRSRLDLDEAIYPGLPDDLKDLVLMCFLLSTEHYADSGSDERLLAAPCWRRRTPPGPGQCHIGNPRAQDRHQRGKTPDGTAR